MRPKLVGRSHRRSRLIRMGFIATRTANNAISSAAEANRGEMPDCRAARVAAPPPRGPRGLRVPGPRPWSPATTLDLSLSGSPKRSCLPRRRTGDVPGRSALSLASSVRTECSAARWCSRYSLPGRFGGARCPRESGCSVRARIDPCAWCPTSPRCTGRHPQTGLVCLPGRAYRVHQAGEMEQSDRGQTVLTTGYA
jgi:hypothetical protein